MCRVLPDVAGFDRELDYLVPPELSAQVRAGSVVWVPLQGRRVRGWALSEAVPAEPDRPLRAVLRVVGWGPEAPLVDLAGWAAWRWAGRRRALLTTASPPRAVPVLPAPPGPPGPARGGAAPAAALELTGPEAGLVRQALARRREGAGPGIGPATGAGPAQGPAPRYADLLQVPPTYRAVELVLQALGRGPVLVVAASRARAEAGQAALRHHVGRVALLPEEWPLARSGADVVIGARAAAWGPCPGMGCAVVLDAHEEGLHQEQSPTWDATEVVAERARQASVPCLWVSACPSLELVEAAQAAHLAPGDAERSGWAPLRTIDRRAEDPASGLYSSELVNWLRSALGAHPERLVVCVLNRTGRAALAMCRSCGELAACEACGGAARVVGEELACRRCGLRRPVVCASCGSSALRLGRTGVSRAREDLEALLGTSVTEVTGATGSVGRDRVVVGTEAVLHQEGELRRAGGVSTIAFLDFDQETMAPRYRAGEQALALLARASRLVGGRGGGWVLAQTRQPGHPVLEAARRGDPGWLLDREAPVRRALGLPPYGALALLSGPGAPEMAAGLRVGPGQRPAVGGERELEVTEMADGTWVVRAAGPGPLAEALQAVGRPAGRVRVEVGPPRF